MYCVCVSQYLLINFIHLSHHYKYRSCSVVLHICLSTCLTTTNTNMFCCCIKHLSSPFLNNFNFFTRKIARREKDDGKKQQVCRNMFEIHCNSVWWHYGGTIDFLLRPGQELCSATTIQVSTVLTT